MSLADQLKSVIDARRHRYEERLANLRADERRTLSHLKEVQVGASELAKTIERLSDLPMDPANPLCPECWAERALRNPLKPIPSQTEEDILRCGTCKLTITLPRP